MAEVYPAWRYYPSNSPPPPWVAGFVGVVAAARPAIDSREIQGLGSDGVLKEMAEGLVGLGYEVEQGKHAADRVRRPVFYGEQGVELVAYEVDAAHDVLGVLVEVESGRGRMSNALYRDLVRASLVVGARFLVLGMMLEYRYQAGGKETTSRDYEWARGELDAIYAGGRLALPFEGILLFGY